jgi:hypothetical protein
MTASLAMRKMLKQFREGEHANDKMYENWKASYASATGHHVTKAKEMEGKHVCGSAIHKPLFPCPVKKESMGAMHVPQGVYKHVFDQVRKSINFLDEECRPNNDFLNKITSTELSVDETLKGDVLYANEMKKISCYW